MDVQETALEVAASQQASLPVETKRWGARNAHRIAWSIWMLSLVLVAIGLIFVLPPGTATWAMAAVLLALAAIALFAALRWLTIERLLR